MTEALPKRLAISFYMGVSKVQIYFRILIKFKRNKVNVGSRVKQVGCQDSEPGGRTPRTESEQEGELLDVSYSLW